MKDIRQIREQFDLITEKEENEDRKLSALVRAGLYDSKKLPALKRALDKSADKITSQEKRMLINLLDSLISQVVSDDQVYRKVKKNVHTVSEAKAPKMDTYSKFDPRYKPGWPTDKEMPSVLILKRKAIRVYPDNQKVALYYSQALDKYVTIPYNDIQTSLNEAKTDDEKKKKKFYLKPKKDKSPPKPGGVRDTKNLIADKGEYKSKISRAISLRKQGLNIGGIVGTMMHDAKKKARVTSSLAKLRASKAQTIEEQQVDEIAPAIGAAIAGAARIAAPYVARGIGALSRSGKGSAKSASKGAAKKSGKGLSAPSKLSRLMRKVGRAASLAGALAGGSGGSGGSKEAEASKLPAYNFTAKPSTSNSFVSSRAASDTTQQRSDQKLARQSQKAMMKEDNVLDTIRSIVDNNITEQNIEFDENKITINNTVAKKLLNVYESINKTNKKKMEQMLNESASSFNKVLMFAVRQ